MATWRLRRMWRLRREAGATGRPFDTSAYENSQALDNNTTWWQELISSVAVPLLLLAAAGLVVAAGFTLWGLLH